MKTGHVIAAIALLALSACGGGTPNSPPSTAIKEYALKGEVVSLAARDQAATIRHEKIEGWMEAMTMDFSVKDKAEFEKLRVGDRIAATVFVRDPDYWIGGIKREGAPAK